MTEDIPHYKNNVFALDVDYTISIADKCRLFFKPMYEMVVENYLIKYKKDARGCIYIFDMIKQNETKS